VVDHIERISLNNKLENLRWTTLQGNNHNKIDNNEHLNIYKRKDYGTFRVEFGLKNYNINKSFKNLEDAIKFRDIIQDKINNNESIDEFLKIQKNKNTKINKYYERKKIFIGKNGIKITEIKELNEKFVI